MKFLLAVCAILLAVVRGPAAAVEPGPAGYSSATVCAQCHAEIYKTWRSSQHASAFTDPAFQLPYDRIRRAKPGRTLPCEHCHNPMRSLLEAGDHRAAIFAQEGVTCDFCHSVRSVDREGPFPRYRAIAGVKFGPRGGRPGKSVHTTKFSPLHITSAFCAGCHEFVNEYGVPVLTTYTEWEESFYRGEGVHCQFCHLPQLFDARFIDPVRKKGPVDHAMVGGHSRERLAKAIPIQATLKVSAREARLTIRLRNETVGHKTPTGVPTHRIRLVSTLYDAGGNALGKKEELFERVLGDGAGRPLSKPEEIFTIAREVLKDNRIGPKETRVVTHVFAAEGAAPETAEVSLTYEMDTPDIAPELRSIDIPISRVIVPARTGIPAAWAVAAALAAACLAAAGAAFLVRRRARKGTAPGT